MVCYFGFRRAHCRRDFSSGEYASRSVHKSRSAGNTRFRLEPHLPAICSLLTLSLLCLSFKLQRAGHSRLDGRCSPLVIALHNFFLFCSGVVAPHTDLREQEEKTIMLRSFFCSSVVYS